MYRVRLEDYEYKYEDVLEEESHRAQIRFPRELLKCMNNYRLQQKDLNFNAIVLCFYIKEMTKLPLNKKEMEFIFKENNMQILSYKRVHFNVMEDRIKDMNVPVNSPLAVMCLTSATF